MIKNYMKIALRNLYKHKSYSVINIIGLAVGIACCLLIWLYIRDEISYDRYHRNAPLIHRVALDVEVADGIYKTARTSPPMAEALQKEFPEVLNAFRIRKVGSVLITHGEKRFFESKFYFADPSVFEILTMPLSKGSPAETIKDPFTVVITEETAKKYFGEENPLGKKIFFDTNHPFIITGVLSPIPSQSHFQPEFLASFTTLKTLYGRRLENWGWTGVHTYLLLSTTESASVLEHKMTDFIRRHIREDWSDTWDLHLQPIINIHLYSHLSGEIEENSDIRSSYFLAVIGFFILIIACFNFVNLTTAGSTERAREVGVRKMFGAFRRQLIGQFLGEAVLLSLFSLCLAVLTVVMWLPGFNLFVGKTITLNFHQEWHFGFAVLAFGALVGLAAGVYPALLLSRVPPIFSLKKKYIGLGQSRSLFRQGLVIIQFAISVMLIIGTNIVAQQLSYFHNKDIGFNEEQLVVIPMQDKATQKNYDFIKHKLLQNPNVLSVSAASDVPGQSYDQIVHIPEGIPKDNAPSVPILFVDTDFIDTLEIKIIKGRKFSNKFGSERTAVIINEAAAKRFGWDDPLGKRIDDGEGKLVGQVVGVMQDFHFESLHTSIQPLMLRVQPDWFEKIVLRIHPEEIQQTLAFLEKQWKSFEPAYPFQYSFLDNDFDRFYQVERRTRRIFESTSVLAVLIACLGIFGLAAFNTRTRTKEIGIRKVLGATVSGILLLFSKDFIKLVLMANIFAVPIAYYVMNRWLQNFAYRIDMSWWVFVMAGGLTLFIALLTVSTQAIRAALADPVDSLRYE